MTGIIISEAKKLTKEIIVRLINSSTGISCSIAMSRLSIIHQSLSEYTCAGNTGSLHFFCLETPMRPLTDCWKIIRVAILTLRASSWCSFLTDKLRFIACFYLASMAPTTFFNSLFSRINDFLFVVQNFQFRSKSFTSECNKSAKILGLNLKLIFHCQKM